MLQIIKVLQEIKQLLELDKPVWTLDDFCLFADISLDQGYKITSSRKINFYRPGGKKIYIDRLDAIAYLRQNPVDNFSVAEQKTNNYLLNSKTAA